MCQFIDPKAPLTFVQWRKPCVTTLDINTQLGMLAPGGLLNASVDVLGDEELPVSPATIYLSGKSLDLTVNAFNASKGLTIDTFSKQPIIQVRLRFSSIGWPYLQQSIDVNVHHHPSM